ncbi:lysophospholipid acyltransferase family protein [Tautonia plasticadhaerens]|uniref:Acyltransferase n=1 Tax=Tautonia plasticadhaerens TaxID=2527974 RepID=A0A518GW46_9BACT|nr:lysophospholipid acyltransferase family protein [Tautonia plasticadhaerens]QDV32817.1 Acyltransferase [Tautonia plasticadhaerens]
MRRMPLADEFPYRFRSPSVHPLWVRAGAVAFRQMLRRGLRIEARDVEGLDRISPLIERGDGVLIAPNHCDDADAGIVFELGMALRRPFYFMAAYQIFKGKAAFVLPRVGCFPVDREGADLRAFKTAVELLGGSPNPLVVFPEGEIYHMADRLTPIREGVAAIASSALRKRRAAGRTVWIVPVGLKYRFLDDHDPRPAMDAQMTTLEAHFRRQPRPGKPLVDRIYAFAEGAVALKEAEYLGSARSGPLPARLADLREHIVGGIEDRRLGRRKSDPMPVRVKELRRVCLDVLADPAADRGQVEQARHDLGDLFVVVQLFSYPGDYVRDCPTLERVAEVLMKLEQDTLGTPFPRPRGPRRAVVRVGEPIDVGAFSPASERPRKAAAAVTVELESRLQGLLDAIGPGRPL